MRSHRSLLSFILRSLWKICSGKERDWSLIYQLYWQKVVQIILHRGDLPHSLVLRLPQFGPGRLPVLVLASSGKAWNKRAFIFLLLTGWKLFYKACWEKASVIFLSHYVPPQLKKVEKGMHLKAMNTSPLFPISWQGKASPCYRV